MGQCIAVLIGNTKYENLDNLPCCRNDVAQIRGLLSATQKFTKIEDAIDKPISYVKNVLRELSKTVDVEEVFLYFSGHGGSHDDEFYMCFEEFSESSPNSTGLSRAEAFELIRLFNAELSVVVIDACESGVPLIKGESTSLTHSLKSGFRNFVQFASCMESQYSLGGDQVSVFTKEFITACVTKENGVIYYSDLENSLRDAFLKHSSQTPHFIRQGTLHEKFCDEASLLHEFGKSFLSETIPERDPNTSGVTASPLELADMAINQLEGQVPSEDAAQNFIDRVVASAFNQSVSPDLAKYFDIRRVTYDDFDNVDNKRAVIKLLSLRGTSDRFVQGEIQKEKRRQLAYTALVEHMYEPEYNEVCYLDNNCGMTSVHVGVYYEPQSMALCRLFSEIVFLPGLTDCLILTCESKQPRESWGSFGEEGGSKKWKWSKHAWLDDPEQVARDYISDPNSFARSYILSFDTKSRKSKTSII
ncbi:MAG: caspase family protein [Gammaproteobacteria bacterium]|nr:caspase family protein [Gammaproteobacteria bacterium]